MQLFSNKGGARGSLSEERYHNGILIFTVHVKVYTIENASFERWMVYSGFLY